MNLQFFDLVLRTHEPIDFLEPWNIFNRWNLRTSHIRSANCHKQSILQKYKLVLMELPSLTLKNTSSRNECFCNFAKKNHCFVLLRIPDPIVGKLTYVYADVLCVCFTAFWFICHGHNCSMLIFYVQPTTTYRTSTHFRPHDFCRFWLWGPLFHV